MTSEAPKFTPKKAAKQKEKEERLGVVYLSYVPQDMTPLMIRQLLSVHGEITRIFLKQRPSPRKRPQYSEGWIEFADRRVAKLICRLLNNQPMTNPGQKKKFYSSELWNIKFLKKLRWADVSDQFAQSTAVRQKQLRIGLAEAKRDAGFFAEQVKQSKQRKRKRNNGKNNTTDDDDDNNDVNTGANTNNNDDDNDVGNDFANKDDDDNDKKKQKLINESSHVNNNNNDDDADGKTALAEIDGLRSRFRRRPASNQAASTTASATISDSLLRGL